MPHKYVVKFVVPLMRWCFSWLTCCWNRDGSSTDLQEEKEVKQQEQETDQKIEVVEVNETPEVKGE